VDDLPEELMQEFERYQYDEPEVLSPVTTAKVTGTEAGAGDRGQEVEQEDVGQTSGQEAQGAKEPAGIERPVAGPDNWDWKVQVSDDP
jgi:hypothetical protein